MLTDEALEGLPIHLKHMLRQTGGGEGGEEPDPGVGAAMSSPKRALHRKWRARDKKETPAAYELLRIKGLVE